MEPEDELNEALLPTSKAAKERLLSVLTIVGHLVFLSLALYVIQAKPKCDTSLVLWVKWVSGLVMSDVVLELIKVTVGKNAIVLALRAFQGQVALVLWIYGHWPVYQSQTCEAFLWYFAWILEVSVDVGVGLVVSVMVVRRMLF